MKIRAKDVKVKIKGDFARKKAKVGRKVKKVNETKIDVKSKKIFVPGQNQITKHLADNEREELNLIIRQLHHYSMPNKLGAISELKDLLTKSATADAYITLILPEVMEMMFDEERDVRKSIISFITFLIVQYQPESFLSIMPVVITYISSGLTNINKAIRKDSLMLLQTLCEHGSRLLLPFMEKLMRNVLSLLQDSFQTISTTGGTQDAHVAQSLTSIAASAASASNKDSKAAASAPRVASMFILTLQVLQALLTTAVQQDSNNSGLHSADDCTRLVFSEHAQLNTAVLLNSRVKGPSSWLTKSRGGLASQGHVPQDLMLEICHRLRFIWQGLVLEDKPIALDTISVLREIGKIILSVTQTYGSQLQKELQSLISLFFVHFPHSCKEATLAKPNSNDERNGNLAVQLLDIALCEIVSVFASKQKDLEEDHSKSAKTARSSLQQLQQVSSAYLLEKLTAHITSVRNNTVKSGETNNELVVRTFSSFELMISIDSLDVLSQLVSVLNNSLLSAIPISNSEVTADAMDVVSSAGDSTAFSSDLLLYCDVMQYAIRCVCDIVDSLHSHIITSSQEESFFLDLGVAVNSLLNPRLIAKYLHKAVQSTVGGASSITDSPYNQLVTRVVRSLLNLIRRFPSCKAVSSCSEPQLLQIQTLLKSYMELIEYTGTSKTNKKEPFFVYNASTSEVRQLLLDIYSLAPFDLLDASATLKISKVLTKNISAHAVPRPEQSYYLRLLFAKRQFMSLNEYIDLLFSALKNNITTRCIGVFAKHGVKKLTDSTNKNFHTDLIQTALDAASHSFVCDIAEVLRWTASADNPTKIIGFIMSRLVALRDSAVDSTTGLFSCDSAESLSSSTVWVAQFGWLGCYTASVSILHLFRVLFASLNADVETPPAVVSILKDSVGLITSVSLAILRDTGCSASLHLSHQENIGVNLHDKYREELLSTVAVLLNVTNIVPVGQSNLLVNAEKLEAYGSVLGNKDLAAPIGFSVFRAVLVEFSSVWSISTATAAEWTQLMRGLKFMVNSRSVSDATVRRMRVELTQVVRSLSKLAGVTVGQMPEEDALVELGLSANELINSMMV